MVTCSFAFFFTCGFLGAADSEQSLLCSFYVVAVVLSHLWQHHTTVKDLFYQPEVLLWIAAEYFTFL